MIGNYKLDDIVEMKSKLFPYTTLFRSAPIFESSVWAVATVF